MSEHRYDIRISKSCLDPNPLMVERQDPDNFTRFQTRERCALEIAAYVFNMNMFARSDEIPSMALQDNKDTKSYGWTDACTGTHTDTVKKVYHPQTQFAGVL